MTELNPDGPDIADLTLGVPGPPEPLPEDDNLREEATAVNDDDPEDNEL